MDLGMFYLDTLELSLMTSYSTGGPNKTTDRKVLALTTRARRGVGIHGRNFCATNSGVVGIYRDGSEEVVSYLGRIEELKRLREIFAQIAVAKITLDKRPEVFRRFGYVPANLELRPVVELDREQLQGYVDGINDDFEPEDRDKILTYLKLP